jgi:hypothetical protein
VFINGHPGSGCRDRPNHAAQISIIVIPIELIRQPALALCPQSFRL